MNRTKYKILTCVAVYTFFALYLSSIVYAQSSAQENVRAFSRSYAVKDTASMKASLSPLFSAGVFDRRHENFLMQTFATNFPCDSMVFVKDIAKDKAVVELYRTGADRPEETVFTFDSAGQILHVAAFDKLYNVDREKASELVARIPFEENNGSVILHARLNDSQKELRLLFDTGADGMAMSKRLGTELGLKVTRTNKASVVGGNIDLEVSEDNTLHIGEFILPHQSVAMPKNFQRDVDGILGNTLLKRYIVKVDYDKKEMLLYTLGKYEVDTTKGLYFPLVSTDEYLLPVEIQMGNGKTYSGSVFFDTGASYNLILFRPYVVKHRLLVDNFQLLKQGYTLSMGMNTPTFFTLGQGLSLGKELHTGDFQVALMGSEGKEQAWRPHADGSLGVGIIGKYNFTIDLLARKIYFEPNKRYGIPIDRKIGNYLLTYQLDGKYIARDVTNNFGDQSESELVAINGISVKEITTNEKICEQIVQELTKEKVVLTLNDKGEESVVEVQQSK